MKKTKIMLTAMLIVCILAPAALAWDQPSSGGFFYEVYEFVSGLRTGALGVVIAMGMIALGIFFAVRRSGSGAVVCAICTYAFYRMEDIVYSLGVTTDQFF